MKKISIILSAFAVVLGMVSCNKELELRNPNNQTTYEFGDSESELQEAVISCYNRIRLEGTFARVGYTMDAVRGDEIWNASQISASVTPLRLDRPALEILNARKV